MPCTEAKARHLLECGKAKVIRRIPFTIKLLWDCEGSTQDVVAGMDTGVKFIGCAAKANGKVIYQAQIEIRDDISKKMMRRKMYRRFRKYIKKRYRKERYLNRASMRIKGRLAPSIKSKIGSHIRERKFVESILSVTRWKGEFADFDIHKITCPGVSGVEYQEGNQKGFYNIRSYILYRDGYQCQKCKKKKVKFQVHHIVFRENGGTNMPSNLITLCKECHKKLHLGEFNINGNKSKTKHPTEMGIIKSCIKKEFNDFEETFGYETKYKREQFLKLSKTHYYDAMAICCDDGEVITPSGVVLFKKHVAKGDYQQTKGKHSEKRIPTGKLFGFRKFDLIKTPKGIGFITSKRARGQFEISRLDNSSVSVNIQKGCRRLVARSVTLALIKEVDSGSFYLNFNSK